jgi:hypothetical protein
MRLEAAACKSTHLFGQTPALFDETAGCNAECWEISSSTLAELIDKKNRKPARQDTPTSPLSKIQRDERVQ